MNDEANAHEVAGTVAVVTGGANGIGLASARAFAAAGADILLADVDQQSLESAREELSETATTIETIGFDARSDDDAEALVSAAARIGPIGVLMLNAGVSSGGVLEHVPISQWQDLFDVNVFGVVRCLNAFIPTLVEQKRRTHVIVTGSSVSFTGSGSGVDAPYVASKHALVGLARTYRSYLARHDIGVQLLAPRMTDTAFPLSSVAWTSDGSFITSDRDIGTADTPEEVATALIDHLGMDQLVIALEPRTGEILHEFADTEVCVPTQR